jgi:hypothetical protein
VLLYDFNWGLVEQRLLKAAQRSGRSPPEPLLNKPVLDQGLRVYLDAFYDLNSERHHGMGYMRIPHSKIREYGVFYGYDEEQLYNLLLYIPRMDNAFIKVLQEKHDGEAKRSG